MQKTINTTVDAQLIPDALKHLPQWVCWMPRWNDKRGKWDKIPVTPLGKPASSTDPATWNDFDTALAGADEEDNVGIGLVVNEQAGITGIDLDNCVTDGIPAEWAQDIASQFNSYTEYSPSGNGLRIFVSGALPEGYGQGRRTGNIEVYSAGRFLTVTGDMIVGAHAVVRDCSNELGQFITAHFKPKNKSSVEIDATPADLPQEKLDQLLTNEMARLTWERVRNDLPDNSASSFDMALANFAAAAGWTDGEIISLLRAWRHKHDEDTTKLDRPDYIQSTLSKARESLQPAAPKRPAHDFLTGIMTADVLCRQDFPEPKWAIDGVVPEGVTLLAGKPKMGKSWMALGFCIAVASGGRALNEIDIVAGDALYLSLEDNPRRLKKRLNKMLPDGKIPPRLHLATDWPRVGEGCRKNISRWLDAHTGARLVIIDTLKKIRPERGKKDLYDADYEIGAALQELAHQRGIAILVIHHLRKSESLDDPMDCISGSTGLTGAVDGLLVLMRNRGKADARLIIDGRDIEDNSPMALEFDSDLALWKLMGRGEEFTLSRERQTILDAARKAEFPPTVRELAKTTQQPYENVRQVVIRMEADGELKQIGGNARNGYTYRPANE